MTLQFSTTKQASNISGVKVLVHGRAGSGKTPLCATAPKPIILSAESGLLSLRQYEIPVILIRSIADLDEAYSFVAHSPHAAQFRDGGTCCLDSVSELAEVCLSAHKIKYSDPRQAYGRMQDDILLRLRWFRDLPMHVYFSAKTAWVKDESTGAFLWGPSMPGQKLGPALPYMFDEIFSLESARAADNNIYPYLRTERGPTHEARDRSGFLLPYEEPHLGKIINKIMTGVQQ